MTVSSQPLVSIVTPVYNGSKYLAAAIESVLAQTYRNWDYTIVDNCSTDGSGEIAARYAEKDSRIRVRHNTKFLQAIANHNEALRQISSSSKYCKVLFGDDWIFPECLERMVAVAEAHPSVGVVAAYTLEGEQIKLAGLPYETKVVPGREICRKHLLDKLYVFGSANSLLYRSDLVRGHDPLYNEANIHADTEACFALLKACDFGFVHQVLTFTRLREKSLSATSSDRQTYFSGMLRILLTYGRDYLTPEEFNACLGDHLEAYYQFLGKSFFLGRDREFWNWHKREIADAGMKLSNIRLAKGALAELFDAMLNPKLTMERVFRARDEASLPTERS